MEHHYVYQTKNLITAKTYIGVHTTNKLDDGYLGSGKLLNKSIKKYGKDNFAIEILSFYDTRKEAFEEEAYIVTKEWVESDDNYNLIIGGVGVNRHKVKSISNGRYLPDRDRYSNGRVRPLNREKGKERGYNIRYSITDKETGIIYKSLTDLGKHIGIGKDAVRGRIIKNTLDSKYEVIKQIINK